jgi:DNA-directed RNA polymerase subunit L
MEDYQNIIEMLKQALSFYANPDNYRQKHPINHELFSYIEMDSGSQANFALNKLRDLENLNKNMEEVFVKNMTNAIETGESVENIQKMIEEFKNLSENDNNV